MIGISCPYHISAQLFVLKPLYFSIWFFFVCLPILSSVCCIFMAYDSSACELLMIAHLINWLPKQHNKSASWRKRVAGTRLGAQLIKCSWRMTTCVLHIKQLHQLCMPLWLQFSWLTQPISLIFVWCFVGMISWKLWKKRLNVKSSLEEFFFFVTTIPNFYYRNVLQLTHLLCGCHSGDAAVLMHFVTRHRCCSAAVRPISISLN